MAKALKYFNHNFYLSMQINIDFKNLQISTTTNCQWHTHTEDIGELTSKVTARSPYFLKEFNYNH